MASLSRRRLWARREADGLCVYCGKSPPAAEAKHCHECLNKKLLSNKKAKDQHPEKSAMYRRRLRKEVVDKYGGVCACCGESNLLFLTIDHINNDGKKDRHQHGFRPSSTATYFRLRREPRRPDLQVLCFNCNLGRASNRGVCPHHKPLTDADIYPEADLRKVRRLNRGCKVVWPSDELLLSQIASSSMQEVGTRLGVSGQAVAARLRRRGLHHLVGRTSR
jgi:hypothetical protein